MEYSVEPRKDGRFVIVADGTRALVICDSREQATRLLAQMNARENPSEEQAHESGQNTHA